MSSRLAALLCLAVLAPPAWTLLAADPEPTFRPGLSLPLPPELPVTGAFGEFRAGHFHAGVDFSTRRELGWPVRAAADGEIYRLKVQARGYGRAVYIRHADGFETVYGHLHVFEDDQLGLERFVAEERRRLGTRYPGDLYPKPPIRVRRGQVIALSGEKGSGPPHLHLELRRDGAPVDPMRYGALAATGFAVPALERLHVLPRGACKVDGRWAPASFPFRGEGAERHLATVPRLEGSCDLALQAKVRGAGTMSLSRLAVDCGEGRFLRADLDRFRFDQFGQVGLVYDVTRSTSSGPFLYRLRPGAGIDLPGVAGAGLDRLEPGRLECTVRAESAAGDTSRGRFALEVAPGPAPARSLPARVTSFDLFEEVLLLNGDVVLDPRDLPEGASSVPGMPFLLLPEDPERTRSVGDLEVHLPPSAFYHPIPVALAPAGAVPPPPPGLKVVSPAVRLAPDGLFLREGARLRARPPLPERSAFYRLGRKGRTWSAMGGEASGGILEGTTRHGGIFAVLQDDRPPRITGVRLRDEKRLGERRLVFPVQEVGQGIAWDGCRILLDDQPAEAEFDPDRGWAEVWLPDGLTGSLPVEATCRDRAGNESGRYRATVSL
jgi:hypothetical protein